MSKCDLVLPLVTLSILLLGLFMWTSLISKAAQDRCFWAAIDGPNLNTNYAACFPEEKKP